ncbi:RNase A-like domain-containing protein [Streptomyces sp. YIM S03343]
MPGWAPSGSPGLAHVLDEQVDPTEAEAFALAASKGKPNGVFTDLQTAQQVVDYAIADKGSEIAKWLRDKNKQEKVWEGTFGAKNSLGWVARTDGTTISKAGNRYRIMGSVHPSRCPIPAGPPRLGHDRDTVAGWDVSRRRVLQPSPGLHHGCRVDGNDHRSV